MEKIALRIGDFFDSPIGRETNGVGIADLVSILLSNAIVIAGIILLFMIIFGGIGMISSAGQNNPQRLAQSKAALTAGIVGFVIIFTAYWIIEAIQILTGLDILNPGL